DPATKVIQEECAKHDPFGRNLTTNSPSTFKIWCPGSLPEFESGISDRISRVFIMSRHMSAQPNQMAVGMAWEESALQEFISAGSVVPELPGGLLCELLSAACKRFVQ